MSSWIHMPDGSVFALESMKSLQVQGATLILTDNNNQALAYPCGNEAGALSLKAQIVVVMKAPAPWTDVSLALVWTSLTPNTASLADKSYSGLIVGSGFTPITAGLQPLASSDAVTFYPMYVVVNDDTTMGVSFYDGSTPMPPAATYTIYYTNDGGATKTTTGLTLTITP